MLGVSVDNGLRQAKLTGDLAIAVPITTQGSDTRLLLGSDSWSADGCTTLGAKRLRLFHPRLDPPLKHLALLLTHPMPAAPQ
jgi:hypothetical protein